MTHRFSAEFRLRWASVALAVGAATLGACGGGGGAPAASVTPEVTPSAPAPSAPAPSPASPSPSAPAATPTPPLPVLGLAACQPSGVAGATDYQVGDGKAYTALDQVPWESLKAGDTVRLFYRTAPFKGKFAITSTGTAAAPIRICGVRGPNNERPIVDGNGALTRTAAAYRTRLANSDDVRLIHERRTVVLLKSNAAVYESYPAYVQIDGLAIRGANPGTAFTDAAGSARTYDEEGFSACIWADRGQNITIADNEVSDCPMAVFSKSSDDGDFAVTKNLRVSGNYFHGHGVVGSWLEHTTYLQSVGVVVEFNRYGPMRSGAGGNQLKDRSAGLVVRYNFIEGGAHSLDLVEAEDFPDIAMALASYRTTLVYGNVLKNDANARAIVHYGGDHWGGTQTGNYGERYFRQGTLYFFNNTVVGTGTQGSIFRISTTRETVQAWNNIFWFDGTVYLREGENDGVASWLTPDGTLNLGVNWIKSGWQPYEQYHPLQGTVTGTGALLTGSTPPFDPATLVPLAGSAVVDAGQAAPAAASAYTVDYQLDSNLLVTTRTVRGARIDLGAVER